MPLSAAAAAPPAAPVAGWWSGSTALDSELIAFASCLWELGDPGVAGLLATCFYSSAASPLGYSDETSWPVFPFTLPNTCFCSLAAFNLLIL